MRTFFLIICLSFFTPITFAQTIQVSNTAQKSAKSGYYDWAIFLTGSDAALDSVSYVQYLLDPTFRDPEVTISDRSTNFRYKATGWGEFEVKVKVVFKSATRKPLQLRHWLKFSS